MPTYKLLRGLLSLADSEGGRKDYKIGDLVPLTKEQAARMKGRVVRVGDDTLPERVVENNIQELPEKKSKEVGDGVENFIQQLPDKGTETIPSDSSVAIPPSLARDWSFIRDRKATEVIDIIKALDDRDDLLAVRAEEGKNDTPRTGVLKAISTRLTQLEEGNVE